MEQDNRTIPITHISRSSIQYIADIALGTINMTASIITDWHDDDNPTFSPDLMASSYVV